MFPTTSTGNESRIIWRHVWLFGTLRGSGNRVAVWYVLVATVGYSLMPLVIDWGKGGDSPFLFNAGWRYGFAAGCLLFLFVSHRRLLFSWQRLEPHFASNLGSGLWFLP